MDSSNNLSAEVCSFCGRPKKDVDLLFRGETGYICSDCVE